MDPIHTTAGQPQRKRRWYQFRLRTMLLAVVPLALGSAWLARVLRWDDTVYLAISADGVVLSSGRTVPLGAAPSLYPLKDDLKQQMGRRASRRHGAVFTARIAVDPEAPCGNVKWVVHACQELGIEHFDFRSAGERMRMHIPPVFPSEGLFTDMDLPPVRVWLGAANDGSVASIHIGDRALGDFAALNRQIRDIVGDETGPGSVADTVMVELACADGLKFKHAVEAYLALSRRTRRDGTVVPLIENVRFLPALGSEYDAGGLDDFSL